MGFLAVAEEFQLKGLMGSAAKEEVEEIKKPPVQKKAPKPLQRKTYAKQEATFPDIFNSVDEEDPSPPLEGTVAVTDFTAAADLQDLDDKIKSMMEVSKNRNDGNQSGFKRICNVCGKEGQMMNIIDHIEIHHITGSPTAVTSVEHPPGPEMQ